jgi:hypothetical protein
MLAGVTALVWAVVPPEMARTTLASHARARAARLARIDLGSDEPPGLIDIRHPRGAETAVR